MVPQTWGKLTSRLVAMEHINNGALSVLAAPFLHFALRNVQSHFESIMMWLYANYAHRHLNAFLPADAESVRRSRPALRVVMP